MAGKSRFRKWLDKNSKYIIPFTGTVSTFIFFWLKPIEDENYIEIAGIIGSFASVTGLVIAIDQISKLKRTSESTQDAVVTTIKKLNNTLGIIDTAKAIVTIQHVNDCLRDKDIRMAYEKLKGLIYCLLSLAQLDPNKAITPERTAQAIKMVQDDMAELNTGIFDETIQIDLTRISANLGKIETYLSEIEISVKFGTYDK